MSGTSRLRTERTNWPDSISLALPSFFKIFCWHGLVWRGSASGKLATHSSCRTFNVRVPQMEANVDAPQMKISLPPGSLALFSYPGMNIPNEGLVAHGARLVSIHVHTSKNVLWPGSTARLSLCSIGDQSIEMTLCLPPIASTPIPEMGRKAWSRMVRICWRYLDPNDCFLWTSTLPPFVDVAWDTSRTPPPLHPPSNATASTTRIAAQGSYHGASLASAYLSRGRTRTCRARRRIYAGSGTTGVTPRSPTAPSPNDASTPPRELLATPAAMPVSRGSGSGDAPTKPSVQCDAFPLSMILALSGRTTGCVDPVLTHPNSIDSNDTVRWERPRQCQLHTRRRKRRKKGASFSECFNVFAGSVHFYTVAAKHRNPALGECRTRGSGPALFATCCGRWLALALSALSAESSRDSPEISRQRDRMQTGIFSRVLFCGARAPPFRRKHASVIRKARSNSDEHQHDIVDKTAIRPLRMINPKFRFRMSRTLDAWTTHNINAATENWPNGKAAADFVTFPDDEDSARYFPKGKNQGTWSAVLHNYFIEELNKLQKKFQLLTGESPK
ncbi:hypothetical protein DFH09DRAFT_1089062 [Mycena vulgaris]|nr:hypothetical protein DFH09DRAFT_1089062 [Mycena vulgaris]